MNTESKQFGEIEPFYESPWATVYLADARDVLPTLATASINLAVTDPPYGVEWQSGRRAESFEQLVGDRTSDRDGIREAMTHCVRLLGPNRHMYTFGPTDVLDGLKVSAITPLVWDKVAFGTGNLQCPWAPSFEPISFTTSKHKHAGQAGQETLPHRVRKGSVLRFPRPTGRKVRHPSEKPVPLLRELVESSSRQGETVLDPFAGILSTGVAAILSGRRAVLVEVEQKWVEIGIERIRRAEEIATMGATA